MRSPFEQDSFRFGRFELHPEAGLLRDNRTVRIQPQPLRVLRVLVARAGELVTRDELRVALWDSSTFVEFDQGLNYCIRQIRIALHDDASSPVYIETIKKRGYRFGAPVQRLATQPLPPAAPLQLRTAFEEQAPALTSVARHHRTWPSAIAVGMLVLAVASAGAWFGFARRADTGTTYTQLTDFGDAAFGPAVSPDGRMIAFIVGTDATFPPAGDVYMKLLPKGDAVQLTHDGWPKYGVAFSPDGSEVTYTVADKEHGWSTYAVSALGGEPRLALRNASGLSWVTDHRVMFSEIKTGLHMALATGTDTRDDVHDLYVPAHERGMAHFGYPSPDRRSILVVEMGPDGYWQRCRLIPFDGSSAGTLVGPPHSGCTAAAWSPDGRTMYFSAMVAGASHLWRQQFPDGPVEQLTAGPAEEQGIAVSRDGRSLYTALGIRESGVWLHDRQGDRAISNQGSAYRPMFSRDGSRLYFLRRRTADDNLELWVSDIASHRTQPLLGGYVMTGYDISPDGLRVVFSAHPVGSPSQIWLAATDGSSPPRMLASHDEDTPFFGPDADIVFRGVEGPRNYLFRMSLDGGRRQQVISNAIIELKGMSPDRSHAVVMIPVDSVPTTAVMAAPVRGGAPRTICPAECMAAWSPDGTRFYVEPLLQDDTSGLAVSIPIPPGSTLPPLLPAAGVASARDAALIPGSTTVDMRRIDPTHMGLNVAPAPEPDAFAYTRSVVHRNIFKLQLR